MTIKYTLNWKIVRLGFFFKFKVWKIISINYDVSIDILLQNAGEASLHSSGSPNTQIWP